MNNELVKILHLEDNIFDAELVHIVLTNMFTSLEYYHVQNKVEFIKALTDKDFHFILSDYNIPKINGIETLKLALKLQQNTPIIFVSGSVDISESLNILRAGATDFVNKDSLEKLPLIINRVLFEAQENQREKEQKTKS